MELTLNNFWIRKTFDWSFLFFTVDMYDFCHFLQRIRSNQHISQFDVLMQYMGDMQA